MNEKCNFLCDFLQKTLCDSRSADARQRPRAAGLQASHVAAGASGWSPHCRDPWPPGQNHRRRRGRQQQRRRRRAAGGRPGHQPEHHRQHPALQTPRSDQEPPHQLPAGGGGGHQPAAGDQQVSDVQRRRAESTRQEEEERKVREEAGRREEEEEGAFVGLEAGGRTRKWTPPGVEVSARPAEGAALKTLSVSDKGESTGHSLTWRYRAGKEKMESRFKRINLVDQTVEQV